MTSNEMKRLLASMGCTFGTQEGSHLKVYHGRYMSILPMHGTKELGKGLTTAIFRQLGLQNPAKPQKKKGK